MSLEELKRSSNNKKIIGAKQVKKAITKRTAQRVYLADDAEPHIVEPIKRLCEKHDISYEVSGNMKDLGEACGIDVGSAAVALIFQNKL